MSTIWKQAIEITDRFYLNLPVGTKVLHVDMQGQQPTLWFLCDPRAPKAVRTFLLTGTGHERNDIEDADYIGTFQMRGGSLVFHLFEANEP